MSGPFGKILHKKCCCGDICESCCNGEYPTSDLTLTFTLLNATPRCACLDGFTMTLTYLGVVRNELGECEVKWEGRANRPCPAANEFLATFICRSTLDSGDSISELQVSLDDGEGTPQTDYLNGAFDYYDSACDPFMYCIRSNGAFPAGTQECGDGTVDDDAPQLELCVTL